MKYTEIVNACIVYLRRPDLRTLVQQRVLNAITAVHSVGIFPQDRVEELTPVQVPAAVGQAIRPGDLRLIEQVIALDAGGNQIEVLARKSATELIKLRRLGQDSATYYETGGQISFKSNAQVSSLLVLGVAKEVRPSALINPTTQLPIPLSNLEYESWLMAENPQPFIDFTVGHMEYLLGNMELGSNFIRIYNSTHREWLENRAAGISGV